MPLYDSPGTSEDNGLHPYPKLDAILGILILDDGAHLQVVLECTGDMIGSLASLNTALNTRTHSLLAQHADQGPAGLLQRKKEYR